MFGLKKILETINPRELRVIFSNYSQRSWQRLIADANKIKLPEKKLAFGVLRECIMKFKPLKMDKYRN